MYTKHPKPTPKHPFPGLNLKVGKMNYSLGNLDPSSAKCLKSRQNFSRSEKKKDTAKFPSTETAEQFPPGPVTETEKKWATCRLWGSLSPLVFICVVVLTVLDFPLYFWQGLCSHCRIVGGCYSLVTLVLVDEQQSLPIVHTAQSD